VKKRSQNNEKLHICREILSYLIEHPDAKDTIEGIVEWWLLEQKIMHQSAKVKEALEELVDKGLIMKSENDHSYYQLNQDEFEKIRSLVTGLGKKEDDS
jgi:hypothetical protein